MKRVKIVDVLNQPQVGQEILIKGWVRAFRSNRFIQINDGSTINTLQAVVDFEKFDEAILKKITTAAAVGLKGILIESQGSGQAVELQVTEIEIIEFNLKEKTDEFNQVLNELKTINVNGDKSKI